MSFLVTFNTLLTPRIDRIRKAFTRRDREELITALLSLHATTTRALAADPLQDQPAKPVLDQLTIEAQDFTRAIETFVTEKWSAAVTTAT